VFEESGGEAVHATMARVLVKGNTIRGGVGFGVYLERSDSGRIEQNEIANNCSGGIMVRDVSNAHIENNQIYQNGHGIVLMEGSALKPTAIINNLIADHFADGLLLIGSAAVVTGNRILRNRHTGLHFSALLDKGGRAQSGQPLMDRNVVTGNGRDEGYDTYRAEPPSGRAPISDCAWRLGPVEPIASGGEPQ
jgi:parallel beta-helix repeat protein